MPTRGHLMRHPFGLLRNVRGWFGQVWRIKYVDADGGHASLTTGAAAGERPFELMAHAGQRSMSTNPNPPGKPRSDPADRLRRKHWL